MILIIGFAIGGEPKSADDPVKEIVDFYVDNKDSVMIGAILGAVAGTLPDLLRRLPAQGVAGGRRARAETLSLISFVGLVIVAVGVAIDATISFALAEAADDIDPVAVQTLQALWDNDFIPIQLGVLAFIWATGISVIRTGALPKWLGWVLILFGMVGVHPDRIRRCCGSAIWILVVSIMLTLRARSGTVGPGPGRVAELKGRRARQRPRAAPRFTALPFKGAPASIPSERCPSGLRSSLGKRVGGLIPASWVRIPPSPLPAGRRCRGRRSGQSVSYNSADGLERLPRR